jgi:glutamate-1-semialdehyde 2,1-aminomutase
MHLIGLRSKYPGLNNFPIYYQKAKGVMIDKYLDMSYMGIGCNLLGYANRKINKAVKKAINNGNMSTLNSIYELELSMMLLEIHKDMDLVRYCKTGGEAVQIALTLAEGKKIAHVNYNGWHVKNNTNIIDIKYNDYPTLIKERPDVLILETYRDEPIHELFKAAIERQQREGMILICDEITIGFRYRFGPYYEIYELNPDLVVYAKAISNGYPMGIILGKNKVMEKDIWISSTYWTENIGAAATLATLKELQNKDYSIIHEYGNFILNLWKEKGLKTNNNPVIPKFYNDDMKQRVNNIFLKNNILASNSFYPSFAHEWKHIQKYEKIIKTI